MAVSKCHRTSEHDILIAQQNVIQLFVYIFPPTNERKRSDRSHLTRSVGKSRLEIELDALVRTFDPQGRFDTGERK